MLLRLPPISLILDVLRVTEAMIPQDRGDCLKGNQTHNEGLHRHLLLRRPIFRAVESELALLDGWILHEVDGRTPVPRVHLDEL
jgi:hypothetical protein